MAVARIVARVSAAARARRGTGSTTSPAACSHTIQAGSEATHALNITSPAGFAELIARAGTPAHGVFSSMEEEGGGPVSANEPLWPFFEQHRRR